VALFTAISIAVATAVNLALYGVGRLTDAAMRIDPAGSDPNHQIVPVDVAWKTAVPLLLGAVVVGVVLRRSQRWAAAVVAVGAGFAVVGIPFLLNGAHDITTGVLLSAMHTVAAATFVAIWMAARRAGE
jgi:hypothetical protein